MFTILIVDDNQFDRECIKKLVDWEALGIRVCAVASNGVDGYQMAVDFKPDFILTDVAMPVMDGLEMTEKIRMELPDTKFIFMSCHDEFDFVKAAINLEVSAYVLKPVDLNELVQAIRKVTEIKLEETRTMKYQEELKAQIRENIPILQENMIRDMLHGRADTSEEIADRLGYLEMPVKSRYVIVLMQIDNYYLDSVDVAIDHKYLTIYQIRNIVRESLLKNIQGYLLIQDYSNLCLVLFDDWTSQEEAFEGLIDQCADCREQINKILDIKLTIGISNISADICEMPKIYQEAEYAVKSKFYSQSNRIILASEVINQDNDPEIDFTILKKEIELVLDRGKRDDIFILLNKYYSNDKHYSENYVKSLCYSFLISIQMQLSGKNESFGTVFEDEYIVWGKLSKFETILDIKQWLANVILFVREHIEKKQTNRQLNIVQEIKDIIGRDYAKIHNIQQIADQLYISSGYANYIFKQETATTIGDCLFETRMEKAKKLLQDPHCRIYEIAENVGYISKSYFGAAFKEFTGMTPRQYRDKYCMIKKV